ncbi:Translation initiation factor IF-2 [Polystyrenella longa]|uniref:Translation initiation factor IF-2 n=1 Tax=Polystyrenella longa TaxID=2528007 RepID=A0A518CL37_9PLAN|nr:translation initiation factor IF-2 [Polystyrenella longa]QDU79942.1 Translation initiation factor IF-2 [Polystyrenella longa]
MKVRIFALAKELGLDSKELIDLASEAGVVVKNSALASISPEERDVIVAHVNKDTKAPGQDTSEPPAPVREKAPDPAAKIRQIRAMSARPQLRSQNSEEEVAEQGDDGNTTTAVETREAQTTDESFTDQDTSSDSGQDDSAQQVAESAETNVAETTTGTETAKSAETTESADTKTGDSSEAQSESTDPEIDSISRDDYVATGNQGTLREMRPRGNMGGGRKGGAAKNKPKTALPNIAAQPKFEIPKKKVEAKSEGVAQKPDVKLTPDLIAGQSPLASHLQKSIEQRGRKGFKPEEAGLAEKARKSAKEEQSLKRDRRRGSRRPSTETEGDRRYRPYHRRSRKRSQKEIIRKTEAVIEPPITVRTLSEAIGHPSKDIMRILWNEGNMVTINDGLSEEAALEISLELGVELEIKRQETAKDRLTLSVESDEDPANLEHRPPIVTILGHVDHGKTSLLDKIRSANVTSGEAGGITQHIASYQVDHNGQKVTFVDTPGHAAFGEMRARGANITDIIVLVVAADDGVMPQTKECISHAKSSGAPIIVAMNKCDLPDADEQKVLQDLAANEILPAEWGGEIEVIRTSATTGEGIENLLETILVTAELHEYKADPKRDAVGVCLEAFLDEGRGVMSWLIVQRGTMRVGDVILCGETYGRVRAMYNDRNEEIQEAPPSTPIKVAGLEEVPSAGEFFFVMPEIEEARQIANDRRHADRAEVLSSRRKSLSLDDLLSAARTGSVSDLPIIVKADAPGSIEAIRSELEKLDHPEVRVQIIHEAVGGVNESDVYLASASGAIIVAFHVIAEDRAEVLAEQEGVDIRRFRIIYELTDTIKRSLEGLLEPEAREVATGRALVLRAFSFSKVGKIAGCRILNGTIDRNNRVHVIRDQTVINNYSISSLRREKDDVKEVREGMECGIRLDGFNDVKEGDLLESYRIETVKRTLD